MHPRKLRVEAKKGNNLTIKLDYVKKKNVDQRVVK